MCPLASDGRKYGCVKTVGGRRIGKRSQRAMDFHCIAGSMFFSSDRHC